MDPPHSASAPATSLRNLLELDRTLSPSDRKVLEVLLLRGSHLSARELSRGTGTNLQALYGALDRLEARGFVARERNGGSTQFRSAHPSVILHSLLEPGKRAAALAGEVEADLRRIYEGGDGAAAEPSERHATTTASPTAASSWLLDLIGGAVGEVWFLGDESPWFLPGASLEGEIASRGRLRKGVQVRMLVPPPTGGAPERPHLDRLERAGVDVRVLPPIHRPCRDRRPALAPPPERHERGDRQGTTGLPPTRLAGPVPGPPLGGTGCLVQVGGDRAPRPTRRQGREPVARNARPCGAHDPRSDRPERPSVPPPRMILGPSDSPGFPGDASRGNGFVGRGPNGPHPRPRSS